VLQFDERLLNVKVEALGVAPLNTEAFWKADHGHLFILSAGAALKLPDSEP
jgi:hypothetical protein